jgi:hypothetical protein
MRTTKPPAVARFWCAQIRKHWIAYLCGFLFWLPTWQGIFPILHGLPGSDIIDGFFSQQFALQRYAIYLIALPLLIYVRKLWYAGVWATVRFILCVFFFPLIVAALVVCGVFQILGLTLFTLEKVVHAFFSTAFFIGSIVAWPVCVYMLQAEGMNLAIAFMTLLGLASLRLLIEIFIVGAQPLRLVDQILKFLVPKYLTVSTTTKQQLLESSERDFSAKVREQRKEIVDRRKLRKCLVWYSTHRGTPQFVTSAFVFVFVLAFLLAALTFAVELNALYRIDPSSLQGLPTQAFLDFFFLSVMWLSTSSPEGIIASTAGARLFVGVETLTGIGLLVFLIQCFSVILAQDLEEGKVCTRQLVTDVSRNIAERQAIFLDPQVVVRFKAVRRNGRATRTVTSVQCKSKPSQTELRFDRLLPPGQEAGGNHQA